MDVSTKSLSNFKNKYVDNNALIAALTFLHFWKCTWNHDLSVIDIWEAQKKVIKQCKRTFMINVVTKYDNTYKVKIARRSRKQSV